MKSKHLFSAFSLVLGLAACGGPLEGDGADVSESEDALSDPYSKPTGGGGGGPLQKPGPTAPRTNLQVRLTNDASQYCATDWVGFTVVNTSNVASGTYSIGVQTSVAEKLGTTFPALQPGQSYSSWHYFPGSGTITIFANGPFLESNTYDNQAVGYCP